MALVYLRNMVTLELNRDKCIGCNRCIEVCPHNVFMPYEGIIQISQRDRCMECGACAKNCPMAAIKVKTGVGCAYAIIKSKIMGKPEVTCECGGSNCC